MLKLLFLVFVIWVFVAIMKIPQIKFWLKRRFLLQVLNHYISLIEAGKITKKEAYDFCRLYDVNAFREIFDDQVAIIIFDKIEANKRLNEEESEEFLVLLKAVFGKD